MCGDHATNPDVQAIPNFRALLPAMPETAKQFNLSVSRSLLRLLLNVLLLPGRA